MLTSSLVSVRTIPARPALGGSVVAARDMLAARVLDSINTDGAIVGECESRVLESVIALCVLQRVDLYPAARARIADYLRGQWLDAPLDPFHHALIASVLGWDARVQPAAAVDAYLGDFEHFTSTRKRVLFQIILAAVSGARVELELEPEDFVAGPEQHSWVVVLMRALEVLYFCSRGEPERIGADAIEPLLTSARPSPSGVWEQYLFGHLLTLLALDELPAYRAVARAGAANLINLQRPDGGFSFITRMEIFATATAGLGLIGAGIDRRALRGPGDFLIRHQQDSGGWGYADGVRQTDVDDTAYCVEFLRALDPLRYAPALRRAERYLLAIQNDDGGFPTFARGSASEVAMTAAALNALAPSRHRYPDVFRRGVDFIVTNQQHDGTFERSWSCAHSNAIFRALLAIQTASEDMCQAERAVAERRALSYLRLAQNENGGWGHVIGDESDPISSAYALITLSHFDAEYTIGRGIDYIVEQQRCNGGYLSRPDGSGPRPIAYDVPALADHFALIALDHVISTHR